MSVSSGLSSSAASNDSSSSLSSSSSSAPHTSSRPFVRSVRVSPSPSPTPPSSYGGAGHGSALERRHRRAAQVAKENSSGDELDEEAQIRSSKERRRPGWSAFHVLRACAALSIVLLLTYALDRLLADPDRTDGEWSEDDSADSSSVSFFSSSSSSGPIFSHHWCIGDSPSARACRFDNLCINLQTRRWQYYVHPNEHLLISVDGMKQTLSYFPSQHSLNLRAGVSGKAVPWAPLLMYEESIPPQAFVRSRHHRRHPSASIDSTALSSSSDVSILLTASAPADFGATLVDDIWPAYNLLSIFELEHIKNARILLTDDCDSTLYDLTPHQHAHCSRLLPALYGGLSTQAPLFLSRSTPFLLSALHRSTASALSADDPRLHLACFSTVLLGAGGFSALASNGLAATWRSFPTSYLRTLGVERAAPETKQFSRPLRLLFLLKRGVRALANGDDVIVHLRHAFPTVQLDALELSALGPWKAQLDYLQSVSIAIASSAPAHSFPLVFLPRSAVVILVGAFDIASDRVSTADASFWSAQTTHQVFQYPFAKHEVAMDASMERNQGEDLKEFGSVRINLERITEIVANAVRIVGRARP